MFEGYCAKGKNAASLQKKEEAKKASKQLLDMQVVVNERNKEIQDRSEQIRQLNGYRIYMQEGKTMGINGEDLQGSYESPTPRGKPSW